MSRSKQRHPDAPVPAGQGLSPTVQWKLNRERGDRVEVHVLESFRNATESPDWFSGIHLGTSEQQQQGIDCVVETTDMGPLFVQVKSSERGAEDFRTSKGHRADSIAVVVIKSSMSHAKVRGKVIGALEALRRRIRP